jgi:hypothetical protein
MVGLALVSLTSCSTSVAKSPAKAAAFQDDMRKLWEDHIVYTRNFIIDAAAGLPEQQATTERLLRNQDDIGNAIKPYYGEENGTTNRTPQGAHHDCGRVGDCSQANDTAKVDDAQKRWFANADAIASFLSGANPKNWPEADMKSMMHDHLSLTNDEAAAQLKSDWKGSIDAYDKIHEQILRMADMLSSGIVAQFPKQF